MTADSGHRSPDITLRLGLLGLFGAVVCVLIIGGHVRLRDLFALMG